MTFAFFLIENNFFNTLLFCSLSIFWTFAFAKLDKIYVRKKERTRLTTEKKEKRKKWKPDNRELKTM